MLVSYKNYKHDFYNIHYMSMIVTNDTFYIALLLTFILTSKFITGVSGDGTSVAF